MTVGEKYKVKPSADGHIDAWWGKVSYDKVKNKIGEYIGHNKNTKLPVLDFGGMGPFDYTCDIPEEHLQLYQGEL